MRNWGMPRTLFVLAFVLASVLVGQDLPQVLPLPQAVQIALSQHGEIQAAQSAIMAREGAAQQASASPNPIFYFQSENWRLGGEPSFSPGQELDLFAYVSQPIETAGKKKHRVAFAQADKQLAEIEKRAVEWRIRQDVKRAYRQVLAAQRNQELLSARQQTLDRLTQYHQVRVRLGAIAEVDLIKVRLEAEKIGMALAVAEMEAERTKLELLRSMGSPSVSTSFEVQEFPLPKAAVKWDAPSVVSQFVSTAMAHRAEVLLGQALVERAQARIKVEQAAGRPNVTPYFGYKRTTGYNTLVGGAFIPLPLFDRNQGRVAEAAAEVLQFEAALRTAKARVRAEVAAAAAVVKRRAAMLQRIETGMIERAEQTSRIALAAYQEGGTDLLNVIDAQRTQNEVGLLYSRALSDFSLSWINLETASGTDSLPTEESLGQHAAARAAARMED
jgi:cobalt-zinc-cadmium efflux system outer membrane protein